MALLPEETGSAPQMAPGIEAPPPRVPALVPPAGVPGRPRAQPAGPRPSRRFWVWGAGAVVVAAVAGAALLRPWEASVTPVAVEIVTAGPVTRILAVNGRIAGVRSVDVRPEVGGTLAEVWVDEGDRVRIGDAVARIDPATQQAVVRQAQAALDAARVAEAEARATFERTRALGANAARAALESAARSLQTAVQQAAQIAAQLDQAQIQLDRFTIRAPLSGTVLVMTAEPGQVVDLAAAVMTIVDMGRLIVETDVDETYATQIALGQPAALQLAGETEVRAGRVSFVSQRVDAATGGLAIELTPDRALIAPIGLTVTANITVDTRLDAITVPRAAMVRDAAGEAVLVVSDGIAQRRPVTVIDWPAARLIVADGLAPGEVVITDATGIRPGQAVAAAP